MGEHEVLLLTFCLVSGENRAARPCFNSPSCIPFFLGLGVLSRHQLTAAVEKNHHARVVTGRHSKVYRPSSCSDLEAVTQANEK